MTTHAGTTQSALGHGPPAQVERLGRYRLLARLGQGGMGTIHLAVAGGLADFRKLLVVKELRSELTSNEHFVQMFLAEAKVAARLQHPNIVQTLEAGQDGERYFLAMEFLDGQPLSDLLKRGAVEPVVPVGMRIQILCEVLAGLQYAHDLCDFDDTPFQIVHRDVNPQNVFITYDGHVKLVDFGIAKVVDSEMCTTAGVFKGKFPYAAPEQVDCRNVDRRVDVFAVGVMLWEILAQRRFAPGQPTMQGIDARLAGNEPRIAEVVPTVDPVLAAICDRAMHVDPAQRFGSAAEFRGQLNAYLAARNELATPAEISDLLRKKFEPERTAIHRLISTQVQQLVPDEELGDSLVRVLKRSAVSKQTSSSAEEPITGSDPAGLRTLRERPATARQRELPQQTQSQRLLLLRKRRKARIQRYAFVATAALVAFGGAYLWVGGQTSPAVPAAGMLPAAAESATAANGTAAANGQDAVNAAAAPNAVASRTSVANPVAHAPTTLQPSAAAVRAARAASPANAAALANAAASAEPLAAGQTANAEPVESGNARPAPPVKRALATRPAPNKAQLATRQASSADRQRVGADASMHAGNTSDASAQRTLEVGDDMRLVRRARSAPARTLEDPFQ